MGNPVKRLFQKLSGRERRKADRGLIPGLVAYYWDGGAPVAHEIRQISSAGMYLLTEQRWYLGTVLIMRLQLTDSTAPEAERSIAVQTKVAWIGPDGIGLAFASPTGSTSLNGGHAGQNNVAGKKAVEQFVRRCFQDIDRHG